MTVEAILGDRHLHVRVGLRSVRVTDFDLIRGHALRSRGEVRGEKQRDHRDDRDGNSAVQSGLLRSRFRVP